MANFEQNPDTRKWSVRFWFTEFGERKQKRLSGFDTKKEADKAYAEFISKHKDLKASDYSQMTFNQLFKKWIDYSKNRIKVSSLYDIKHNATKNILPYFGEMKIFKITKYDIINWQSIMTNKKYSFNFKSALRSTLSSIFKFAVLYYELPVNPVSQVETFKRTEPKKEMQIWSKKEFSTFISCVDNEMYKTLFSLLYLTGCRKGEALALSWDRINFDNATITINKNLTKDVEKQPYLITSTKTGNSRTILIPQTLLEMLKELKNEQDNAKKEDFVFGCKNPIPLSTLTRKFNYYIQKSGVKQIHLHCLRHSHASLLISEGESIVMVAKRLGHSSIEQTLNTYSHLMPNEEQKMIKKLNFLV